MANFWKSLVKGASGLLGSIPYVGDLLQNTADDMWKDYETDQAYNRNLNYQQQLMSTQNQYNVDMFNRQLEANRNSIKDQMAQYRDLGINPLAVTGGIQQTLMSQGSGSSIPSPFEPQSPVQGAQIELLQSEALLNRAQANAIDPEEARSRTESNKAFAEYYKALTKTEDGMRIYKISNADKTCNLTVSAEDLNKKTAHYYEKMESVLDAQIQEANSHRGLMDEQKQTEIFNRQQLAFKNKQEVEHWKRQDSIDMKNAITNANNLSLAMIRWQTEKSMYQNQSDYWKQITDNLKKEGRLKDIELQWQEDTLEMRFKAFGAEFKYHIKELEDGSRRIELDLEYLNKHGGLLLKRQYAEDMNAFVTGAFTPAFLNAKYGTRVVGAAAGAKFMNGAGSGVASPPPVPTQPQNGGFWY